MSSYIGNIDAERVNPANTVDVIAAQVGVLQYELSQDVPGGYEANVTVVRNGSVLTPEVDYAIDHSLVSQRNTLLTFNNPTPPLSTSDQIFVVHRGSATYNLTPSPKSVTEDSLADNLRDFVFESFVGASPQTDFDLTKRAWQPRGLLVSLNGVLKQPYIDIGHPGDYTLVQDDINNISTLQFAVAPGTGVVISVLHLEFSTVLRRSDYLTAILLSNNIIQTQHIQNDAVTGPKILLANNDPIRSTRAGGGTNNLIKLNASNQADINGDIIVDGTQVSPITTEVVDLGTTSKKFKDLHMSGDATIGNDASVGRDLTVARDATVDGDLTVNGALNISGLVGTIPIGAMMMYYGVTAPDKYMLCDGSAIPLTSEYATLRAMCGANTPDLRQRIPIGLKSPGQTDPIATSIGQTGGNFQHSHIIADHNHNLLNTHVTITDSGHSHLAGTLTVTITKHRHEIVGHSHPISTHYHDVGTFHKHNIATDSYTQSDHQHNVKYNSDLPNVSAGGNLRQMSSTGPSQVGALTPAGGFTHSHSGATTEIGGSGAPNWGVSGSYQTSIWGYTTLGDPWGSPLTATGSSGTLTSNFDSPSDTTYNLNTASSSAPGTALVSVQAGSRTEDKTGLTANNNTANSQPYLTVNFIIRALE